MQITLSPDLAERLYRVARRLKRSPDDCALAAIRTFVTDCEESFAQAAPFGDGVARIPDDGFMD
ncbi:hypothetical protein A6A04_03475 [Paramagnetospirillum marisnigri]|uniref:Uncharacterized protein n=1 Tax=Paramagnetospirillum marisnigri TaxID=1285242 RepID=A0A178MM71_9PROT|nr:hypothetical protein [Paramagnetospirillum marisnigri]OAN49188.1 hypothetical protein A6A04_03475 [Paramagnetospirillum marisnigri]